MIMANSISAMQLVLPQPTTKRRLKLDVGQCCCPC